MKPTILIFLFIGGLILNLLISAFQAVPGYMDAEYYFAGGLQLAQGAGFSEPFLWNYLDDPVGLPHPSHAYWMPLASLISAAGMLATGKIEFWSGRMGFLLLSACAPPVTALLAYRIRRSQPAAILAGLFALFPAFYLPYLSTTDTFGLYMILGGAFLLVVGQLDRTRDLSLPVSPIRWWAAFGLGLLTGGMHLARADGILWLFTGLLVVILGERSSLKRPGSLRSMLSLLALVLLGYLVVMGPWMVRNLSVFHTLLAPGGSRALWLTTYDELYAYPAHWITPERWWQSGLETILAARLQALGENLQTAVAVQGQILLAPLVLAGFWQLRRNFIVHIGWLAWIFTFAAMTVAFPFAGGRGGFFHSGAALQPLFWAVAPVGLEGFIQWGVRVRGWQARQAWVVFSVAAIIILVALNLVLLPAKMAGSNLSNSAWNEGARRYQQIETALQSYGAALGEVVVVNNPPGYFLASGRPAISIPWGDLSSLQAAARRYQAHWLILELGQIQGGNDLYEHPATQPGIEYLGTANDARLYRLQPEVMVP